jgi:lipopolysaccharide export system protein LptC
MTKVLGDAGRPAGEPGPDPTHRRRDRPSDRLDFGAAPWRGAFTAAGRHSAWVLFLRRATLIGSALGIVLISGVAFFDPFRRLPQNISIGQVVLEGTRVTVETPKISGLQKDGRPYEVKARSGIQDTTTPNVVELLGIDAKIGTEDASTVQVTAAHGVYDGARDQIALQGDVRIWNDAGYDIRAETATMDFKTGVLGSDKPVNVILNGGTIAANRMDIRDNGRRISFEGAVKSLIEPAETDAADASMDRGE